MSGVHKSLQHALARGKVVPFVGAGVSQAVTNTAGESLYPGWGALLRNGATKLRGELREGEASRVESHLNESPPNLVEAAEVVQRGLGPRLWTELLRDNFERDFAEIDPASLALAKAVWLTAPNLVITTNYDLVLRWSCPNARNLREWELEDPHGFAEVLENTRLRHPSVWHLHGSIVHPTRLVLATDGYDKLYASSEAKGWRAAYDTLKALMRVRHLLFVGFSGADRAFMDLLKSVTAIHDGAGCDHYLLVRNHERAATEKAVEGTNIICVEFEDFGEPLIKLLTDLGSFTNDGGDFDGGDGGASSSGQGPAPPGVEADSERSPSSANVSGSENSTPSLSDSEELNSGQFDPLLILQAWAPSQPGDRKAIESLGGDSARLESLCASFVARGYSGIQSDRARDGVLYYTIRTSEKAWRERVSLFPETFLERLLNTTVMCLGEDDPRLDLEPSERIFAHLSGRAPSLSLPARSGLATTLVRLSHSDQLLERVHGSSRGTLVAIRAVRSVLDENWKRWASLGDVLPILAEAAPDAVMAACESSLDRADGVVRLFEGESQFGANPHVPLLWTLETLSWLPKLVPRVALALARLAAADPGGSLVNRPSRSLAAVLNPFLAEGSVTAETRLELLGLVRERYPVQGQVVVRELVTKLMRGGLVVPIRRPQFSEWPCHEGGAAASPGNLLDRLFGWWMDYAEGEPAEWSDLLTLVWSLDAEQALAILDRVAAQEESRANLWGMLRRLVHDGHKYGEAWKVNELVLARIEDLYARFEPLDPIARVSWLFNDGAVLPEPARGSWREEQERLDELRADALIDLWESGERQSRLAELLSVIERPWPLGWTIAKSSIAKEAEELLLAPEGKAFEAFLPGFTSGRFQIVGIPWLLDFIERVRRFRGPAMAVEVLLALPPTLEVWALLSSSEAQEYWRRANVYLANPDPETLSIAISGLLSAGRVDRAMELVSEGHAPQSDLLRAVAERLIGDELASLEDVARLGAYHLDRFLRQIDDLGEEGHELAIGVEIRFLQLLEFDSKRILALYKYLAAQPEVVAHLVVAHRGTETEESVEISRYRVDSKTAGAVLFSWVHYGERSLDETWLRSASEYARRLLTALGEGDQLAFGAYQFGELLGRTPKGNDGAWPSEPVRALLGQVPELSEGLYFGRLNCRGVVTKSMGEGGHQERQLVHEYSAWADAMRTAAPEAAAVNDRLAEHYRFDAEQEDARARNEG